MTTPDTPAADEAPSGTASAPPAKRGRGRPRKVPVENTADSAAPAVPPVACAAPAVMQGLAAVAAATGSRLPDMDRLAPRLHVNVPITAFARAMAQHLRLQPIFRRVKTGAIVTVCERTGDLEPMPPVRFVSWAEQFLVFVKTGQDGADRIVSLTETMAARVLAADVFRGSLRELREVNLVRLPAWTSPEQNAVKLLPTGYDELSQSYTLDTVPYTADMLPDDARQFLLSTFREFPFARPDSDPEQPLERNRSFAVLVAGLISTYCRHLLGGGLRPAFAVQANQAGSGKTLLVRMMLAPVFGAVAVQTAPRDENELGKLLTATLLDGHSYLVVDNLAGYFASQELESFLTSQHRSGRLLGQSMTVKVENNLTLFVTGNALTVSPDIARRSLLLDLWFAGDVAGRTIENPIEEDQLCSAAMRGRFLAALWALVKHWSDLHCRRSDGARLPSYEKFSAVVGGIVTGAAFADPIARPEVRLDETEAAWMLLFRKLADDLPPGGWRDYTVDEIMEAAQELELVLILIGEPKSAKASLGKRLTRWKGREFKDTHGRPFEFGRRHSNVGSKYRVRNLLPEPEEAAEE